MGTPEFPTRELVSELVPHKDKMLLLDRVNYHDLNEIVIETEVDIHKDCMFFKEDLQGVPSYVAFEYMAQSISALSGIYGRTKGDKPKVGFIMSVSGFKADIPVFKDGETVVVTVHETVRMDKAVTFDGVAKIGDKIAVTATLNTVEVDDPKAALGMN